MSGAFVTIEEARDLARRRLPRIFFDYIDGGAFGETTLQANRDAFRRWSLQQHVLRPSAARDLRTDFLGGSHGLPFMLGPVGFLGLYSGQGEQKAARAARDGSIPFCLSTFSVASIGQVRAASDGDLHFQLYVMKDRGLTLDFVEQARAAGVTTLFVTVDCSVTSIRERDVRNGFRSVTAMTPALLAQMLRRPAWLIEQVRHGPARVGALAGRAQGNESILAQAAFLSRGLDPMLSWDDIAWLRQHWPHRLVVKGVLTAEDAATAGDAGADGVVISNHGGRQLDGAAATLDLLPEIRARLGERYQVLIDGGFRRGGDIIKALALGADAVLLGRAYVYGLAASGQQGVARAINLLAQEIDISLALMGFDSIAALKRAGRAALR